MRILAIDTALGACAAAVYDSITGAVVASESLAMARGHAEALMPLAARVMDAAGLDFVEIDRFAVTVGPGSFTGLRVGIAAARGLALVAGRPAIGVSTIAAYAAPHIARDREAIVLAAVDARHDQAYLQVFGPGGRTLVPAQLARLVALPELIAGIPDPVQVTGSAAALVAAHWPADRQPPVVAEPQPAPDIAWVARLGVAADAARAPPKPLYLRSPDARPQDAARLPRQ